MNKIEYIEFMDLKGKPLLNPGEGVQKIQQDRLFVSVPLIELRNNGG